MSRVVAQDVVDQLVIDTLTETNVFVGTIPSGEWVGNAVLLEQTGRYQNSGSSQFYTIRLYIGSSGGTGGTLATEFRPVSTGSSSLGHAAWQRWTLMALDSDSLRVIHRWGVGGLGSDGGLFVIPTAPGGFITNRMEGLSLSGAVEIRITVQLSSVTGTTHQFSSRGVWAALLTPAAAGDIIATPATVAGITAIPTSTELAAAISTPATTVGTAAVPAPTILAAAKPTPATVVSAAAVPAPTVKANAITTPATVAAVAAIPTPTVTVGGAATASPATVAAITAVPGPTVQGAAIPTPATVVGLGAVPAPSPHGAAITAISTVAGIASIPTPTIQVGGNATVTPATVVAVTIVGSPTTSATSIVAPATVGGIAQVPAPTVLTSTAALATPMTVVVLSDVPAPTVFGGGVGVPVSGPQAVTVGASQGASTVGRPQDATEV